MAKYLHTYTPPHCKLSSEASWTALYNLLLPLVRNWVYSSHIYAWIGQENDVIWDIVLVAIQRTFEFSLKAQQEEITIISLNRLSITIAKNYYHDLRRKDSRIIHFDRDNSSPEGQVFMCNLADPSEMAFDMVYQEWLFTELAREIALFPPKLKTALLIDLANRMHFDAQLTPLQQAFLEVGIRLQDYQRPLPTDPVERTRHFSLVSLAYRRIAKVFSSRQSSPAA